jgi:hypothetical protein
MKIRRIIFYLSLLAFAMLVFFLARAGITSVNQHLSAFVGEDDSDLKFSNSGFGITRSGGHFGVSVKDMLVKNRQNPSDTVFYAKHVIISTGKLLSDDKAGKILLLSPELHVYGDPQNAKDISGDSLDLKDELPDLTNFPSAYISYLSLVIHRNDTCIRIDSIHIKGQALADAYHLQIKYQSDSNVVMHCGADLQSGKKEIGVENGFIDYNSTRMLNFKINITTHHRDRNDIQYHVWADTTDLQAFSTEQVTYGGFYCLDSKGKSGSGKHLSSAMFHLAGSARSHKGAIDSMQIQVQQNKHVSEQDSMQSGNILLSVSSGLSFLNLDAKINDRKNGTDPLVLNYVANMDLEDINIWPLFETSGKLRANYHLKSGNDKSIIRGKARTSARMSFSGYNLRIDHFADKKGSITDVENADKWESKTNISNLFDMMVFDERASLNCRLHHHTVRIPDPESGTGSMSAPAFTSDQNTVGIFGASDIKFHWLIDSLYYKGKLISYENDLELSHTYKGLNFSSNHRFNGNINGPLKFKLTQEDSSHYTGNITSAGFIIKDKSRLPLINKNLKLETSAGKTAPFTLPFFINRDSLVFRPASIEFDSFYLLLSGTLHKDKQRLNIGITAPGIKFKGPARVILKNKGDNENIPPVQTVILHVHRNGSKTKVKTTVPSGAI